MALDLTISNEQKIKVTLTPVTASGKPAKLDGDPIWTVLSGGAKVNSEPDGLSAYLVSSDEDLTDTVIQVDADADLGTGIEAVSDTITLHTTGVNAKNLGITAGEPEDK